MKDAIMVSPPLCGAAQSTRTTTACTATGHGESLAEWLTPGSMLVYVRMLRLPEDIHVDGRCYGYWLILDPACAAALEELVVDSGWQFFRMKPLIDVNAFGRTEASALAGVLQKATRKVENENLNAPEVAGVECSRKLGLHTARILAWARHVQNAPRYHYAGGDPIFRPTNESLEARRRNVQ